MAEPLSDEQVHDRLQNASEALGDGQAVTTRGSTALAAGRRALSILQFALLRAMEDGTDYVEGVTPVPPAEPSTRD